MKTEQRNSEIKATIPAIAQTAKHCAYFVRSSVEIQKFNASDGEPTNFVCFSTGFIDYWFLANDTTRICHASLVISFIFVSQSLFFFSLSFHSIHIHGINMKNVNISCFTLSRILVVVLSAEFLRLFFFLLH